NLQGYNTAVLGNGTTPACAIGVSNVLVATGPLAGTLDATKAGVTLINAPGPNNNYRAGLPPGLNNDGQVISSGLAGTVFTPGELIFYPNGQITSEVIKQDDYQYNAGMKFNVMGWDVDADIGYGKDIDNIYTYGSGVK